MSRISQIAMIALLVSLAVSYGMIIYFVVLLLAMHHCYSQPVGWTRKVLSIACIAVTWFYIIHFMIAYVGPMNSFDAAYADVIWGGSMGNWSNTQMLLTWAVIAMVWSAEASAFYQLFGVFGAMSASYLLFRPKQREDDKVQLQYAVFSVLAFACIALLPWTTSVSALSWLLWTLHVSLLAPKFISMSFNFDRCSLYFVLALMAMVIHMSAGRSFLPNTECRISITIDAVVCALITLGFIYDRTKSLWAASAGGCLMPFFSPGCVLGVFCALEHGLGGRIVTGLQELAAGRARRKSAASDADSKWKTGSWMNLGYWKDTDHYDTACQELAKVVGKAAGLGQGDLVLSVACGYGDELSFFQTMYGLKGIVGLDSNAKAASGFKPESPVLRFRCGDVGDIARGERLFQHGEFSKIVAVDSIYHCDKKRFFEDCAMLLPLDGTVAVTDVVVQPRAPGWLRGLLSMLGIRVGNQWAATEYSEHLEKAGLTLTSLESLEPFVLTTWFPSSILRYLDYAIITARVHKTMKRPTAAVVGSGLSGLVAAHLLGKTHDVTIFEGKEVPGFAGAETKLSTGAVVDIPLRMIEPHYWKNLVSFCRSLGVPLIDTYFTVSIYGDHGPFLKTNESLSQSILGNLGHYVRIFVSAVRLSFTSTKPGETLIEFMSRLGLDDSEFYRVYVRRHLSWVLSCTYEMVDNYPAQLVLDFFRAIQTNYARQRGPTMRIDPSVKRLEDALLAGKSIRTGQPVQPFKEARTINGTEFDAVVIATEASAVAKLLPRPWASLFGEFKYHPSLVYVHRDPSLMPKDRADWRAVNVCDDPEGVACQITVWVNAFYGSVNLGGDVFETVNPARRPEEALLIKEVRLQRVVHTPDSARLQAAISALQGREGFYFCGAYAVPGMGLLEQACLSAQWAAEAVCRDHKEKGGAALM